MIERESEIVRDNSKKETKFTLKTATPALVGLSAKPVESQDPCRLPLSTVPSSVQVISRLGKADPKL